MIRSWFELLGCLLGLSAACAQPLPVVTTTTDLAALVREIGGQFVTVEALCQADQDPHAFEPLPAQMSQVREAGLYVKSGLGLDPWVERMTAAAGNSDMLMVDASRGVTPVGSQGHEDHRGHDAHPEGNPHYWLGPSSLPVAAANIRDGLTRAYPEAAPQFALNYERFSLRLDSAFAVWRAQLLPCHGTVLVSAHPAWDYFARDFGLQIAGTVSPMPGAEPSPVELARLESAIRKAPNAVFLREPFTSQRIPAVLERDTGIQVMLAPASVGGVDASRDLWTHFDYLVSELARRCR